MKRSNNALRFLYFLFLSTFICITVNVFIVSVFKYHVRSGTNYSAYIDNASIIKETIHAKRGSIYASSGEIIAQDMDTYDVMCYLSESRKGIGNIPAYVDDPANTSKVLSEVLNGDEKEIFRY